MICKKCGYSIPDGKMFCTKCGSRLENPIFTPAQVNSPTQVDTTTQVNLASVPQQENTIQRTQFNNVNIPTPQQEYYVMQQPQINPLQASVPQQGYYYVMQQSPSQSVSEKSKWGKSIVKGIIRGVIITVVILFFVTCICTIIRRLTDDMHSAQMEAERAKQQLEYEQNKGPVNQTIDAIDAWLDFFN